VSLDFVNFKSLSEFGQVRPFTLIIFQKCRSHVIAKMTRSYVRVSSGVRVQNTMVLVGRRDKKVRDSEKGAAHTFTRIRRPRPGPKAGPFAFRRQRAKTSKNNVHILHSLISSYR
jgi:hypothetical protein